MRNKNLSILLILTIQVILIISCAGHGTEAEPQTMMASPSPQGWAHIDLNDLAEGSEIRASGYRLMDQQPGLVRLTHGADSNDSVLVIAVHGYHSSGYEWVTGLKNLGLHYGSLFFFRYDWERCPQDIAHDLTEVVKQVNASKTYERIVIFGHSYGGVVVAQIASLLGNLNAEIHVIAAPLAGFAGLTDSCAPLDYGSWSKAVRVIQHRTVKDQDGAFRELDMDPQEVDLPFYEIRTLPPTMDGHRLGHNWSVTWVLDQHVGKAHRL